jgi:N-acetylmuramoyl-L-alanine amidase
MPKLKVLLNFSNQTHNTDTNNVTEQANMKELAYLVKQKLDSCNYNKGLEVIITQSDNTDNLQAVVNFEHQYKPNRFISLHGNGGVPSASGTEVWCAIGDQKGHDLATKISTDISKLLGIPDRGAKTTNNAPDGGIHVVDYTNATAVLIETYFQSNSNDVKKYNVNKNGVANAIAWAIITSLVAYDGLKSNVVVLPPKPTKQELINQLVVVRNEITKLETMIDKL